jgi:predicted CXXCH cytochrome family protein
MTLYRIYVLKVIINYKKIFRPGTGRIAFVFLLFFFFGMEISSPGALVLAADVELLTPHNGATVLARNPETHLVLRKSGTEGSLQVRVEQSGAILEPAVNMEGEDYIYLHFRLPLIPGLNKFSIIPGGQQLEVTYQPLQGLLPLKLKGFYFFHQNDRLPESCVDCHDLQETGTIAPVGLQQQTSCITCHPTLFAKNPWQHSPAISQQCLTCHQQSVNNYPMKIGFREGRIDETCLTCHTAKKDLKSRQHIHGAMIGGCTLCHNPHGSKHRYLLWAEGSLWLCITCHDDKQNLLDNKDPVPYVHGIIFGKGCIACHDPHASDEEFMLLKRVNNLCVSCHPALAGIQRGHPVANHPVSGASERRRPNRELTCVSCHDPHGSSNQFMLFESKLGGRVCRVCHRR